MSEYWPWNQCLEALRSFETPIFDESSLYGIVLSYALGTCELGPCDPGADSGRVCDRVCTTPFSCPVRLCFNGRPTFEQIGFIDIGLTLKSRESSAAITCLNADYFQIIGRPQLTIAKWFGLPPASPVSSQIPTIPQNAMVLYVDVEHANHALTVHIAYRLNQQNMKIQHLTQTLPTRFNTAPNFFFVTIRDPTLAISLHPLL